MVLGVACCLGGLHLLISLRLLHRLSHLGLMWVALKQVRGNLRDVTLGMSHLLGVFLALAKGIWCALGGLAGLSELRAVLGRGGVLLLAHMLLRGRVHEGVLS